jgi:hypothetical protein
MRRDTDGKRSAIKKKPSKAIDLSYMTKPTQTEAAKRLNPLEIITLILSIFVLIALLIQSLVPLPPDAVVLLDWMDLLVCIVFLTGSFIPSFPTRRCSTKSSMSSET